MTGLKLIDIDGEWVFVGKVPVELAYTMADGTPVTDEVSKGIAHCGPGVFSHLIRSIRYASESEARDRAKEFGYEIDSNRRVCCDRGAPFCAECPELCME